MTQDSTPRAQRLEKIIKEIIGPNVWVSIGECKRKQNEPVLMDIVIEGAGAVDKIIERLAKQ